MVLFCNSPFIPPITILCWVVAMAVSIYFSLWAILFWILFLTLLIIKERKIHRGFREFAKAADVPLVLSEWKECYAEKTKEKMEEVEEILRPYLKPFRDQTSHHIGSTAIIGMFGKPSPDFSVVTEGVLPNIPDSIIAKFEDKGWKYFGPAPHSFSKYRD